MRVYRRIQSALSGALITGLAVLLLGGCALNPASQEQRVVDRAQARWDAIVAGDLETAYTLYSPGYRSAMSVIDFAVELRTRRVAYTSAEYVSHECEEARCKIKFLVGFRVPAPVPGMTVFDSTQQLEDSWVRTNGEWWYLPEK